MQKLSRTRTVAWAVAAAVALPAMLLASHSWGGYHWARTSNPFNLKTIDSVTSAWDSYLNTSIADWSQSTVLNLTKVAGDSSSRVTKKCAAPTGQVRVCNNSYGNNGWLGIAGISITGGTHITKGYVKLNDTYYNTSTYNTPAWRNLVMCQEIGHAFGLDHQDENFDNANLGTCMDYTSSPGTNQHPNAHDYQMLEQIYAHLDSTTTVGASLPTSREQALLDQLDQDHPAAWGRLVKRSKSGGTEIYELDLGGGKKQVTFVVWTLEAAAKRRAERQHDGH
ncbi:MAG: hypothetical protein NDJ75_01550 [Thermoanaerobaculia bacterium]|nr:hypothetical protein [Thermoanaerobaculia bacterium]